MPSLSWLLTQPACYTVCDLSYAAKDIRKYWADKPSFLRPNIRIFNPNIDSRQWKRERFSQFNMWFQGIFVFHRKIAGEGTYVYPYYFHRGSILTSHPTPVGKLLLLFWLVYWEYSLGVDCSLFTHFPIRSYVVVWVTVTCVSKYE